MNRKFSPSFIMFDCIGMVMKVENVQKVDEVKSKDNVDVLLKKLSELNLDSLKRK